MQVLFTKVAGENQVLPLMNMDLSKPSELPSIGAGRTSITYRQGATGIPESSLPETYNRSWSVTAAMDATPTSKGVIAALGGTSAGWSIYLDAQRHPVLTYRLFNLKTVTLRGNEPLAPGKHELRFDFNYDGGGYAKGGVVVLTVDGKAVGQDHVPGSPPAFYSIDETFDVGLDHGSPVGAYPADSLPGYAFTDGTIDAVTISLR
jgi:arylsulfatase